MDSKVYIPGDRSVCIRCGGTICYDGKLWRHVHISPVHAAEPIVGALWREPKMSLVITDARFKRLRTAWLGFWEEMDRLERPESDELDRWCEEIDLVLTEEDAPIAIQHIEHAGAPAVVVTFATKATP